MGNLTGILNDNELHLTEVKGVLSVRPNLTYLDKSDRRAKQEGKTFAAHLCAVSVFVFDWMQIHKRDLDPNVNAKLPIPLRLK